jgi:hypothetical protein
VPWLNTALDFSISALDTIQSSVKPEHCKTPSLQQSVLGNRGIWTIAKLSRLRVFA